jgi:2-oxoglutarate ferredoxin oxidoreductase subunit delta
MAKDKVFRVVIHEDVCKGCKLCVEFCPKDCLAMTADRLNARGIPFAEVVNQSACIGCRSCATVCPDAAIEVFEVKED